MRLALLQAGTDLRRLLLDAEPGLVVEVGLLGEAFGGGGVATQHRPQREVGSGLGIARRQLQRLGEGFARALELSGAQPRIAEVAEIACIQWLQLGRPRQCLLTAGVVVAARGNQAQAMCGRGGLGPLESARYSAIAASAWPVSRSASACSRRNAGGSP